VLALAGIGLIALAFLGVGFGRSDMPRLDEQSQLQRLLPIPAAPTQQPPETPAVARRRNRRRPKWHAVREARPVHLEIPAIGVSTRVVPLGLNSDHTMQVPTSFAETGWFEPGPEPGEIGAAVIVGHVDSVSGPGVFYRLPALERGDRVRLRLADGRTLRFVVTNTRNASKQHFPTKLVFRHTKRPTLRLITCGGAFDPSTGHYLDNHIVFAWLLGRQ
jgi:LPXTG-site transpeptidase (sortase) family protein